MSMSHNDGSDKACVAAAAAKVAETPVVEAYLVRMKEAMADYMAVRPSRIIWTSKILQRFSTHSNLHILSKTRTN